MANIEFMTNYEEESIKQAKEYAKTKKNELLFGSDSDLFDKNVLKSLLMKYQNEIAKRYIRKYFIYVSNGKQIAMYSPHKKYDEYDTITDDIKFLDHDVIKTIVGDYIFCTLTENGSQKKIGSVVDYILRGNLDHALLTFDVNKPRVFEHNGEMYINTFQGWKWTQKKEYNSFSPKIKDAVHLMWEHIRKVWCSQKKDQFKYVKRYLCHMINGEKQKTCITLKSGQGTGKSLPCDFIQRYVLGNGIANTINTTQPFMDKFNSSLKGLLMCCISEPPAEGVAWWENFGNALKEFITGDMLNITFKHKETTMIRNMLCIILMANHDAFKLETDDRRHIYLDIDESYKINVSYFDKLREDCMNDAVGEAFYWYCKEFCETDEPFNALSKNEIPNTSTKNDNISENIHSLLKFIKFHYVLKNKGFETKKVADLVKEYIISEKYDMNPNRTVRLYNLKQPIKATSQRFRDILNRSGIYTYEVHKQHYLKQTHDELLSLYTISNWIDPDDVNILNQYEETIVENENEDKSDYTHSVITQEAIINNQLQLENEQLKHQIKLLEIEIKKLKKQPNEINNEVSHEDIVKINNSIPKINIKDIIKQFNDLIAKIDSDTKYVEYDSDDEIQELKKTQSEKHASFKKYVESKKKPKQDGKKTIIDIDSLDILK